MANGPDFAKQRLALRYWLLGARYHKAAEALEFAETYHTGMRKDGVTPELSHQVAIAHYVRTLVGSLRHPEDALSVALLHDVREDYDVDDESIRSRFGDRVADAVDAMTKVFRGVKRDEDDVFATIAQDDVASVVKGADRIHNQSTMWGTFSLEKIQEYTEETERLFLPMLKLARRRFPDQEPAYENVKLVLHNQLELLAAATGKR